jgi:hypothetical protein
LPFLNNDAAKNRARLRAMKRIEKTTGPDSAPLSPVEMGNWIGKAQAFSMVAEGCSAAGAACLKRLRESHAYESVGLTWEKFCAELLGMNRSTADRHIQHLEEFGEPFFQLARITPVSPESYRQIAPAVTEQGLEFGDEVIPITAENAARIRRAVDILRRDLQRAGARSTDPSITQLMVRLDACFDQMSQMAVQELAVGDRPALIGLVHYCMNKLQAIEKSLKRN